MQIRKSAFSSFCLLASHRFVANYRPPRQIIICQLPIKQISFSSSSSDYRALTLWHAMRLLRLFTASAAFFWRRKETLCTSVDLFLSFARPSSTALTFRSFMPSFLGSSFMKRASSKLPEPFVSASVICSEGLQ